MARSRRVEHGAFARVEAGGRLVEAQQHRVGAHGAGDLQAALVAVGQRAGRIVGAVRQLDAIEPIAGDVDRRRLGLLVARRADEAEQRPSRCAHQRIVLRDDEVLEHRHAGKQPDVLEGAGDARAPRDLEVGHALEQEEAVGSHAVVAAYVAAAGGGEVGDGFRLDRGRRSTAP